MICVSFFSDCLALALSSGPTIAPTYLILWEHVADCQLPFHPPGPGGGVDGVAPSDWGLLRCAPDLRRAPREPPFRLARGFGRFAAFSSMYSRGVLEHARLGTPSRALAAFGLTLNLVALDVEPGVADDRVPRWFRCCGGSASSSALLPVSSRRCPSCFFECLPTCPTANRASCGLPCLHGAGHQ